MAALLGIGRRLGLAPSASRFGSTAGSQARFYAKSSYAEEHKGGMGDKLINGAIFGLMGVMSVLVVNFWRHPPHAAHEHHED